MTLVTHFRRFLSALIVVTVGVVAVESISAQVPPGGGRNSQIDQAAGVANGTAPAGGAGGTPGAGGAGTTGGGVLESSRSYVVDTAIVVIMAGGALWCVCKSARRV